MTHAIEFLKRLFRSQRFYLVSGITSSVGTIPASFLFVRGVRDAVANFKHKNWKGFWAGVLKTLPMIICIAGVIFSLVAGYRISIGKMSEAYDTISRLSGIASSASVVGGSKVDELVDKVTDKATEKKEAESQVVESSNEDKIIEMVDGLSGRRFQSSVFKVKQAMNDFNAKLVSSMDTMTVNDWYYYLGLEETEMGEYFFFQIDPTGNGQLRISFAPRMIDGVPVTYLCYRVQRDAQSTRLY